MDAYCIVQNYGQESKWHFSELWISHFSLFKLWDKHKWYEKKKEPLNNFKYYT